MTPSEQVEAAVVHSVAGTKGNLSTVWAGERPFIAPHHSVTQVALIGGGAVPRPGAVSLAHHGVLFIDEVAEARPNVLDALRVPMESRVVELMRQRHIVRYPAQFQLILAANPCPCGAEFAQECTCPGAVRARYQAKLSDYCATALISLPVRGQQLQPPSQGIPQKPARKSPNEWQLHGSVLSHVGDKSMPRCRAKYCEQNIQLQTRP